MYKWLIDPDWSHDNFWRNSCAAAQEKYILHILAECATRIYIDVSTKHS